MDEHNVINDAIHNQKNYVALILDRSSSMESLRRQAVSGLNEYIQTVQGEKDQTSFVTLCTFASDIAFMHLNDPPEVIQEITEEQYRPYGNTAMLDAVGDVLTRLEESTDVNDKNNAYLIVIISDGQENASKRFNASMIAEKINKYTANGNWTFVYIGSDQDLGQIADMGFSRQNMSYFSKNASSYEAQNTALSDSTKNWYDDRKKGQTNKADFFSDDDSIKQF